jgi:hypothetical protein
MTTSFCAAPHPDDPEVFCNRPGSGKFGNHQFHSGFSIRHDRYVDWDNKGFAPVETDLPCRTPVVLPTFL